MIIKQKNGLSIELNENDCTAQITTSPEARGNLFIPRKINYQSKDYEITSIKSKSFQHNNNIFSITFANDSKVSSIGQKAFYYCSIETLSLPASIENLEEGWCNFTRKLKRIFISPGNKRYKCLDDDPQIIVGKTEINSSEYDILVFVSRDIDRFTLPSTIKHIGSYALNECNIKNIKYPENTKLETIGEKGLNINYINRIYIPESVKLLKDNWIGNIYKLEKVEISSKNKNFKYINENSMIIGKSDPNQEEFDSLIFADRNITEAKIPPYIKYINSSCFFNCKKLKNVQISANSNLITIGKSAFRNTAINKIMIPCHVKSIEKEAFFGCKNLKMIFFFQNSELVSISKRAFHDTALLGLSLSSSMQILQECWCSKLEYMDQLVFPPNNKNFSYLDHHKKVVLGKSDSKSDTFDTIVFASRFIENVAIPSKIKHICPFAFSYCTKLKHVTFSRDSQLESIGRNAFSNSSIVSIDIPSSLRIIGAHSFYNCRSLYSLKIPENSKLEKIQKWAFYGTLITHIFIPATVDVLEEMWFEGMSDLDSIIISPENKRFSFLDENHQIICSKSDINSEIFDVISFSIGSIEKVIVPSTITKIASSCFMYCDSLVSVEFEKDSQLEVIERLAFYDTLIENIKIPSHVNFIGNNAFGYCLNLVEFSFENNSQLTFFSEELFEESSIEKLTIPESITEIKDNWCANINSLDCVDLSPNNKNFVYANLDKNIIIGKSDSKNDDFDTLLFACRNIEQASIPDNIKYIKSYSFFGCSIREISIPKSVELIENYAFSCMRMETVNFEEKSKNLKIKSFAFSGSPLRRIVIPTSNIQIDYQAFLGTDINTLELLGENISLGNLHINATLFLLSIPNANRISIDADVFTNNNSDDFSLFTNYRFK